jgi:uncharacterized protein YkwD
MVYYTYRPRMEAMRRYIPLILIGIFSIGLFFAYPILNDHFGTSVKSSDNITAKSDEEIKPLQQEFISDPLIHPDGETPAVLSAQEVIFLTNRERKQNGGTSLTYNSRLTAAAKAKLDDMFAGQYFEHISPEGHGPGYIIDKAGYKYIVVGENLALGNFKDNASLVKAWMDSPGHRANILNTRFTEIGVAVGEGMYNGKKTWLAVQEFGLPATSCPIVDTTLKTRVDADTIKADAMSASLIQSQQQLRNMSRTTPEEEAAYRTQVEQYNNKVTEYNKLVAEIKENIETYNRAVRSYNQCVEA